MTISRSGWSNTQFLLSFDSSLGSIDIYSTVSFGRNVERLMLRLMCCDYQLTYSIQTIFTDTDIIISFTFLLSFSSIIQEMLVEKILSYFNIYDTLKGMVVEYDFQDYNVYNKCQLYIYIKK